jgi:hypothetical protein
MATVIYTISDAEMVHRCWGAAATLWRNPEATIRIQPGVFRASGWSPERVIKQVLRGLASEFSHAENSDAYEEPSWRCWVTRRPGGDYILKARRVF